MSITITNSKVSYGPNLITDGLTIHLDSNNSNSYPGSGTIWYDLSGNGNNGTLNLFTAANADTTSGFDTNTGYMMFDRHLGSADGSYNNHITIPTSASMAECLSENGVTIEFWLRMDTYGCTALTRWPGPWEIYYCSNLVHRTIGTGGSDGNSAYAYTQQLGKFHHIIATHNGTNRTLYVNGVNKLNDINNVTNQTYSATLGLGAYNNGQYAFQGAISIFRVYNKSLNITEILQNYNAQKSRFGL